MKHTSLDRPSDAPDATPVDRTVHLVRGAFRNVIGPAVVGTLTAAGSSVNTAARGIIEGIKSVFTRH